MIFPMISPQATTTKKELPICREVKWDYARNIPIFSNGSPVIIERAEAVLAWAWKALHTERYRHDIYTWDYGCELAALIGTPYTEDLKAAEAARIVRECLLQSPYITDVQNIDISFEGSTMEISCAINTIYGNIGLEARRFV